MSRAAPAIECRGVDKRYGPVVALDGLDLEVPPAACSASWVRTGQARRRRCASWPRWAAPTRYGARRGAGGRRRRGEPGGPDRLPGPGPALLRLDDPTRPAGPGGKLHGMGGRCPSRPIDATLTTVGLADAARRSIGGFSGGMRQRLGLAQAILNRPPVLLLDEPVSSLDPQGRHDMLETIRGLGGEATVLFSTHILTDVERVCDRVAIIDHGKIVTASPMDDLLARYATPTYVVETVAGRRRHARLDGDCVAGGARRHAPSSSSHGTLRVTVATGRRWRPAAAGGACRAGRDGHWLRAASGRAWRTFPAAGRP